MGHTLLLMLLLLLILNINLFHFQFKRNRIGHIRTLTDLDFRVQPMDAIVTKECRDQLVTNSSSANIYLGRQLVTNLNLETC